MSKARVTARYLFCARDVRYEGTVEVVELNNDSSYTSGRSAPEGSQPILNSSAQGKTNGRQG